VQELTSRGLILAGHDISSGGMITAMLEMCFANPQGGLEAHLDKIRHADLIKILFSENPGVLIQVKHHQLVEKILNDYGLGFAIIARPIEERKLIIAKEEFLQELISIICVTSGTGAPTCSTASRAVRSVLPIGLPTISISLCSSTSSLHLLVKWKIWD